MALKIFWVNNNKIVKSVSSSKANEIIRNLFKFKKLKNNKFKNLIYILNIKVIEKPSFLTFNTKKNFNYLK